MFTQFWLSEQGLIDTIIGFPDTFKRIFDGSSSESVKISQQVVQESLKPPDYEMKTQDSTSQMISYSREESQDNSQIPSPMSTDSVSVVEVMTEVKQGSSSSEQSKVETTVTDSITEAKTVFQTETSS